MNRFPAPVSNAKGGHNYYDFHFPKPRRYILRVRSYLKRRRMVQRGRIKFNVIPLIISERELLQRQGRATPGDIKWNQRGKHFLQTVKATSASVSQNYRGHISKWLVSQKAEKDITRYHRGLYNRINRLGARSCRTARC